MTKNIFRTVKNFRSHSVFQGKRKLLKNPKCKKYIQYSQKFQGKRKLLKNPECKKYIQYMQWKISGQLSFSGKAQSCSKILHGEKIKTAYIHLEVIHVIWASVLCNLDQRREWL